MAWKLFGKSKPKEEETKEPAGGEPRRRRKRRGRRGKGPVRDGNEHSLNT